MKVASLVVGLVALVVILTWPSQPPAAPLEQPQAKVLELHQLRLDPALTADERRWILVAVGHMRPEALRLIAQVPGTVTVNGFAGDGLWLLGRAGEGGLGDYAIGVNTARLDRATEAHDRDGVVAHELGHVIEMTLLSSLQRNQMVAELPSAGGCPRPGFGDCARPSEKFADTFAKWALHGRLPADQGYAVAAPASLDAWGAPLSELAGATLPADPPS